MRAHPACERLQRARALNSKVHSRTGAQSRSHDCQLRQLRLLGHQRWPLQPGRWQHIFRAERECLHWERWWHGVPVNASRARVVVLKFLDAMRFISISEGMSPNSEITVDLRQRCDAWLERSDRILSMKSAAHNDGVHFTLSYDVYDPAHLPELMRSMAMRALGYQEEIIVGGAGAPDVY